MRFVPIKTKEQQTALPLHRARQLLVRQRTMLSNALRGHLAELGIVSAKGRHAMAPSTRDPMQTAASIRGYESVQLWT
jgi:transposase